MKYQKSNKIIELHKSVFPTRPWFNLMSCKKGTLCRLMYQTISNIFSKFFLKGNGILFIIFNPHIFSAKSHSTKWQQKWGIPPKGRQKGFIPPSLLWTLQLLDWIGLGADSVKIIWNAWQGGNVEMVLLLHLFSSIQGVTTKPAFFLAFWKRRKKHYQNGLKLSKLCSWSI